MRRCGPCTDHIGATHTPMQALSACNGAAHFSAAFLVGRRSRFERRVVKPALSTCRTAFRRFLLGASAAAPSSVLHLRRPPPCISRLALPGACGECGGSSGGLPEAGRGRASGRGRGRGRGFSWVASGVPGGGRWSSLAVLGERSGEGWCSSPVLCI